ncbi:substrate-binding periplasmic protein [Pseudoalteromonas spongiae]|uniref:substrate-binding periplasmic protein n=1 Tax=Pseudoalteromonas spongiae TaxID=298657 RepID=UPI000C2D19EF|nr:transporter substrate-binding domain-containing protein [Pseudoalteromonas spongiae]
MRNLLALLIVLFIFKAYAVEGKPTLVLVADPWCPYSCNEEDVRKGYMVELASIVFNQLGYKVEYQNMPWSRAIKSVKEGDVDGIIGAGRDEVPELIFPETPLGVAAHTFFTLKKSNWTYSSLQSLNTVSLGVIQNYSYGTLYDDYIKHHGSDISKVQLVSSLSGLEQNLSKLVRERVDVIIEDRNVVKYHYSSQDLEFELREAGVVSYEEVYIAFSPKLKEAKLLAYTLSKQLKDMRKSGELAKTLSAYGINDWHKSTN